MTQRTRDGAGRKTLFLALAILATVGPLSALAKLESWRDENAAAFQKGKRESVVVSDAGKVRLGHVLDPIGKLDAARVWDLAVSAAGDVFAATGDDGKVFRKAAKGGSAWETAYDSPDTQALSLAIAPDGRVVAGTGPSGQVVDVSDPKHAASRPHADVKYIWDLAYDRAGNLYAATGPTGQLWKRSSEGKWSLLLDSKHSHLLCVAVAADGSIYAGSDGEGLVYKVAPGGKTSVVYDATQNEIRALAVAADGTLYAGTAAESGGGSSSGRGSSLFQGGGGGGFGGGRNELSASTTGAVRAQDAPATKKDAPKAAGTPAGGSATPRPVSPGENAVYRIDGDGVAREVFRAKAMIYALALRGDDPHRDPHLLVGTGPEGLLYEIRDQGRESVPLARLDNGQILALATESDGGVLIGAGDPGAVVRLSANHVASGTITSEVRDTKLISRFGALSWRGYSPEGTSIALQARTGNVSEPDETWSDWSEPQSDRANARAQVPAGRFVQYRAKLATTAPAKTPELTGVTLRYQSANLAPEINRLEVPDVSALDGAVRQSKLTFRWDVSDPNDDELEYSLFLRKDGWPEGVKLHDLPLTDKTFSWDSTSVPTGRYRLRLVASDRPSNNAGVAQSREKTSDSFLVDHEAPTVALKAADDQAEATLKDELTRIAKAAYAVDGGEWTSIFPVDGLFDTSTESLMIPLDDLKPGMHILVVRATDAAGNVGTGDLVVTIKK